MRIKPPKNCLLENLGTDTLKKHLAKRTKTIAIVVHTNPDGDAIGSALGLYHYLLLLGFKQVAVIAPNAYASFLQWMPGNDQVLIAENDMDLAQEQIMGADILFCLDFNGFARAENLAPALETSKALKIIIDHHPQPEAGFDVVFHDTKASSTAELVYLFIELMGDKTFINRNIAECLYAGIVTDTGSFSYGANHPRTYEIVARLMALGVDGSHIHRLIYSTYSPDRMRLLGFCLSERLVVKEALHTAFISLSIEDMKRFNYQEGDTEGVVNYALAIKNIRLAALFMERDDHVKVSLRSTGSLDVNRLARQYFQGGGHMNAAGGKTHQSLQQSIEDFVAMLQENKENL